MAADASPLLVDNWARQGKIGIVELAPGPVDERDPRFSRTVE